MSHTYRLAAIVLCCVSLAGVRSVAAADADTLVEALTEGNVSLGVRYRYEQVRQPDLFDKNAHANTLRSRLSYQSGNWQGLQLRVEMDHVGYLTEQRFNSTRNGRTDFPVVADPKGADLNQFALDYRFNDTAGATLGRQRINLDNQRFIGGVGWRQNEQTFDAASLDMAVPGGVKLRYVWIDQVRRIFGPEQGGPPAAFDSDSHLLHLSGAIGGVTLSGYAYALDLDEAPALSSLTTGLRVSGRPAWQSLSFPITLEYARQRDYADNPVDFGADYLLTEVGVASNGYGLTLGRESLGADADAGVALQTPLATMHAFQGFTDIFLTTPADGVVDQYVRVSGPAGPVSLALTSHWFDADRGDDRYGREINVSAGWQARPWLHLLLKAADYQARDLAADTRKLWAQATLTF
ncbi:alginate export family protein [Alcanivorax sp. JB21]|uniref:alginate export family protein n=1 Tax=Alcanivorax limicola TaxID=2874102 RepID=UPI001CBBA6B8|nr:alginate export family protein [Alcanivorax limicola]MBZ2187788.1 alginate export family protein [Alcanivorax limicola]